MRMSALIIAASVSLLTACTSFADDSGTRAVTDGPEVSVANALALGARAEAANDIEVLHVAASLLKTSGAEPADGEDLAARWEMMAMEQGAEPVPDRGRTAGPAYRDDRLGAGEELTLREVFHSGRTAVIVLRPREGGIFRLQATNGTETICEMEARDAPAECRWTPIWTEPVDVRVTNLTGRDASYFLVTN